ncbi:hypothetical protein HS1genome_2138 [Sulfodiicoccus acidiphilus]|uniref:Uncharacterized protein n=1 Tax=Sulfodiicoccus acidiphilus TaxID=1670455 RepID=A0A348B6E7_9CREN|nr:hypothetical protein [Sulfodiicoccus acidiphilus]BBD73749.1 hypothetical protein HS1genome_2138 [Sulfodiicoccus acidiphilus]GGT98058.1 hypothetical protein GCM10007116_14540 [Sulfodiicoccus acidiphilus]
MGTEFYDRALMRNALRQALEADSVEDALNSMSEDDVSRICSASEDELTKAFWEVAEFIMGRYVNQGKLQDIKESCRRLHEK